MASQVRFVQDRDGKWFATNGHCYSQSFETLTAVETAWLADIIFGDSAVSPLGDRPLHWEY